VVVVLLGEGTARSTVREKDGILRVPFNLGDLHCGKQVDRREGGQYLEAEAERAGGC
jgi:hypothetical protein